MGRRNLLVGWKDRIIIIDSMPLSPNHKKVVRSQYIMICIYLTIMNEIAYKQSEEVTFMILCA